MYITWNALTQQQRTALRSLDGDHEYLVARELGEQLRNLGLAVPAGSQVSISPLGRAIIPSAFAE